MKLLVAGPQQCSCISLYEQSCTSEGNRERGINLGITKPSNALIIIFHSSEKFSNFSANKKPQIQAAGNLDYQGKSERKILTSFTSVQVNDLALQL